jgi:hypothetical protein
MTRVRLVVTGDLEKLALGRSLERALRQAGAAVSFERPLLVNATTTNPLPDLSQDMVPRPIERLARALVTETLVSPSGGPLPDLVVGIDDLELANAHQPGVVTAWVARAVRDEVARKYPSLNAANRVRSELRERCSFHLLAPLAEAYFFGEPGRAALTRAGVAASTAVHLVGSNVEDFETNDPTFLPNAQQCNASKAAHGLHWWREERHPKRYLEFLVQPSGYDETRGGVAALEGLDWPGVGAAQNSTPYARALFEDISDRLVISNPLGPGPLAPCTYPERAVRRGTLTLRNL